MKTMTNQMSNAGKGQQPQRIEQLYINIGNYKCTELNADQYPPDHKLCIAKLMGSDMAHGYSYYQGPANQRGPADIGGGNQEDYVY